MFVGLPVTDVDVDQWQRCAVGREMPHGIGVESTIQWLSGQESVSREPPAQLACADAAEQQQQQQQPEHEADRGDHVNPAQGFGDRQAAVSWPSGR